MPYATPTSPIPSPAKEYPSSSRKAWRTPPTHIEDIEAGPSTLSGPMPGIPRRSSSSTGHSTPRRVSPQMSRQPSGSQPYPVSKPMEGLPRRSNSAQGSPARPTFGVAGLPNDANGEGSLGLKLHPSPIKASGMQRGTNESISSTSTLDSVLISTPDDEPKPLPPTSTMKAGESSTSPVPFPAFEPPARRPSPARATSLAARPRPTVIARRGSGLGHQRGNGQTGSLQIPFPTSASTSQLHNPSPELGAQSLMRPTSSMIRKKSGEVVKPSLKIRSMSTPDLTRQHSSSEPGTPDEDRAFPDERSKSVRFADADDPENGALESVVLFLREQKVTAIGKAADPDRAGFVTETETENDTDASDFVQFRTRRNAAARATDEAEKYIMEGNSRVPRVRTDFAPDGRGSLAKEHVVLERAELLSASGPLSLRGTVIVRNIAFQKWVSIRFTLDHWQTTSEVSGTHVCHIPSSTTGDEGWDRFTFTIKLDDFRRRLDERQLIMCVRFSVDGREWWDSNDGINYNFTFKKAISKRPSRASGPAVLSPNGYMRLAEPAPTTISGLRQGASPSRDIPKAFGADTTNPTGARQWTFPRLAAHINDGPLRSESPAPKAPPTAYKVPPMPDVHTHLSLSKRYCAPSPPQSPPQEEHALSERTQPLVLSLNAVHDITAPSDATAMNLMGGQFATLSPPRASFDDDRRSSWNGNNESWDSFAKAMEIIDDVSTTPQASSTDGDVTPIAAGSRSPSVEAQLSGESSPEPSRPLSLKRSTGDLRSLLDEDDTGLMTPPPSNLSSPPSPGLSLPGAPMSPPSSASTGESSPVNTVSTNDSVSDLMDLAVDVDPTHRGRSMQSNNKMLNQTSYEDFINKFCFFQSPRDTPSDDEPVYCRPSFIPLSGAASPGGFPFFPTASSNSPRGTPTPTRQYDSANDAFNFTNAADATPKGSATTPKAGPRSSPAIGHASIHEAEQRNWAAQMQTNSPTLAAQ